MYKTKLGQLYAYMVGHVLVAIGQGADINIPLFGLYLEGPNVSSILFYLLVSSVLI